MSKSEDKQLLALAKGQGLTKSAWVRSMVRIEFRRLYLEEAPHNRKVLHRRAAKHPHKKL
jgi:hypothetical protein